MYFSILSSLFTSSGSRGHSPSQERLYVSKKEFLLPRDQQKNAKDLFQSHPFVKVDIKYNHLSQRYHVQIVSLLPSSIERTWLLLRFDHWAKTYPRQKDLEQQRREDRSGRDGSSFIWILLRTYTHTRTYSTPWSEINWAIITYNHKQFDSIFSRFSTFFLIVDLNQPQLDDTTNQPTLIAIYPRSPPVLLTASPLNTLCSSPPSSQEHSVLLITAVPNQQHQHPNRVIWPPSLSS